MTPESDAWDQFEKDNPDAAKAIIASPILFTISTTTSGVDMASVVNQINAYSKQNGQSQYAGLSINGHTGIDVDQSKRMGHGQKAVEFTLAHEVAHGMLLFGISGPGLRRLPGESEEVTADRFASFSTQTALSPQDQVMEQRNENAP